MSIGACGSEVGEKLIYHTDLSPPGLQSWRVHEWMNRGSRKETICSILGAAGDNRVVIFALLSLPRLVGFTWKI